jgi:hypothetical protein
VGAHSGPTSEVDLDGLQPDCTSSRVERDCSAVVGQVLSAVGMADQRTLMEDSFVALAVGSGYLVEAASTQVASHPSAAEEPHGCSDQAQEQVQVRIGSGTVLDGTAVAPAAVVVEACSSDSQEAVVDGMIGSGVDEGVAGKVFDTRKPCWDCKILAGECSTMSFVSSFA